jgi:hypothetical protein
MFEPVTICEADVLLADADPRRTSVRYACHHVTFYRPPAERGRESQLASVCDISAHGIGLLVRRCVKLGAILIVELHSTIAGVSHMRLARVTHATLQPSGSWCLGCEFARRLSDQELEALQ